MPTPAYQTRNFLIAAAVLRDKVEAPDDYPFSIPAIGALREIRFEQPVTFFIGENGSGKSTLLEAIAVRCGLNAEGGSRNFNFSTRASHSSLQDYLRLTRSPRRERDSYFLRAESYFIYQLDSGAPSLISYRETEHYRVTRQFLTRTGQMLDILLDEDADAEPNED